VFTNYPPSPLSLRFKEIVENGGGKDEGFIGYGSGLGRDEWAGVRGMVEGSDSLSRSSLECIDNAALIVCLDEETGMDGDEESRAMLHGERGGGGNRWYDKHCLVRMGSGKIGINFEHR